jgi:hypothetical protein
VWAVTSTILLVLPFFVPFWPTSTIAAGVLFLVAARSPKWRLAT